MGPLGPIAAAEDALARLDERVARSEVGAGFAERADRATRSGIRSGGCTTSTIPETK